MNNLVIRIVYLSLVILPMILTKQTQASILQEQSVAQKHTSTIQATNLLFDDNTAQPVEGGPIQFLELQIALKLLLDNNDKTSKLYLPLVTR